jgi:hypothetical protein
LGRDDGPLLWLLKSAGLALMITSLNSGGIGAFPARQSLAGFFADQARDLARGTSRHRGAFHASNAAQLNRATQNNDEKPSQTIINRDTSKPLVSLNNFTPFNFYTMLVFPAAGR